MTVRKNIEIIDIIEFLPFITLVSKDQTFEFNLEDGEENCGSIHQTDNTQYLTLSEYDINFSYNINSDLDSKLNKAFAQILSLN